MRRLGGRISRRWAHSGPLSTYGPKSGSKLARTSLRAESLLQPKCPADTFAGRSRAVQRGGNGGSQRAEGPWRSSGRPMRSRAGARRAWRHGGPVRDSAPLKNGGRWTRVGTDLDAGPAPLGTAGKTAGRGARSKPSSAAVAGPRVLLAYAEHFSCAGRARGRGAATAHRRGPTRGRDRLARRTSTMEKVELLMIGREATKEASGDAEAPTKSMARAGAPAAAAPWLERAPVRV
jgi:hypothetical protein